MQPIEIRDSRSKTARRLFVALVVLCGLLWMMFAPYGRFAEMNLVFKVVLLGSLGLVFLAVAPRTVRQLRSKEPWLRIDEKGITDRLRGLFVPWSDVESVRPYGVATHGLQLSALHVALRNPEVYAKQLSPPARLWMWFMGEFYNAHLTIQISDAEVEPNVLIDHMNEYVSAHKSAA
ncbi:MAG TPA: STM3941 family protein [Rubricoccaceae bacterium]|jgi:hypothetical protein|nr:STM3941 family protein [Rubricoccaceae bacterium]